MKDSRKTKDEWGAKWLITVNAPTLTALFMTVTLDEMPVEVTSYKIGYEVGAAGNLHKHIYLTFNRSWRRSALINRFKGAQIDRVTPGTEQTVIEYIGSPDKETRKGCEVLWSEIWGNIDATQGQRNDITATEAVLWQIKDAIDAGERIGVIWNNFFPYMVRFGGGVKQYYDISNVKRDSTLKTLTYKSNDNHIDTTTDETDNPI